MYRLFVRPQSRRVILATASVLGDVTVEDFSPETTTRDADRVFGMNRGSEVADNEYYIIS